MPPSIGEESIHIAELREAHLRYLLATCELGRIELDMALAVFEGSVVCLLFCILALVADDFPSLMPCI